MRLRWAASFASYVDRRTDQDAAITLQMTRSGCRSLRFIFIYIAPVHSITDNLRGNDRLQVWKPGRSARLFHPPMDGFEPRLRLVYVPLIPHSPPDRRPERSIGRRAAALSLQQITSVLQGVEQQDHVLRSELCRLCFK